MARPSLQSSLAEICMSDQTEDFFEELRRLEIDGSNELLKHLANGSHKHGGKASLLLSNCLFAAIKKKDSSAVKLLLDHNADVNSVNASQQRPLHVAVTANVEIIIQLLDRNADVNATDHEGKTALHLSLELRFLEAASTLAWRRQCKLNQQTNSGETALHYACQLGMKTIVQTLLNKNANPCMKNDRGFTPLGAAVFMYRQMEASASPASFRSVRRRRIADGLRLLPKEGLFRYLKQLIQDTEPGNVTEISGSYANGARLPASLASSDTNNCS